MSPYKLYSALQAEAAADNSLGAKLVSHLAPEVPAAVGEKTWTLFYHFPSPNRKQRLPRGDLVGISSSWNSHWSVGFKLQILSKSRQGASNACALCCSTQLLSCPPALLGVTCSDESISKYSTPPWVTSLYCRAVCRVIQVHRSKYKLPTLSPSCSL